MSKLKLGRKIVIPRKSELTEAPYGRVFSEPHYEVLIGIGKDHTATLSLSKDAWEELNKYKNNLDI